MVPGYTIIDNDAIVDRLPEIDGTALKVYLVLARHANAEGNCWPSVERIGIMAGLQRRAVQLGLRRLKDAGLIEQSTANGKATTYSLRGARPCAPNRTRGAPQCTPGRTTVRRGAPQCRRRAHDGAPRTTPMNYTNELHQKNKAHGKAAAAVEIPSELDSADFREAWERWEQHRKEIKKTLTPSTTAAQLRKLATWGVLRAVAAIEHSIEKGWQGIFEPSSNGAQNGKQRTIGPGQRHPSDRHDREGVL